MPGIRDVAKRAGVAISTASAAMNGTAPVSADVIAKVNAAAKELDYVPNQLSQSLRRGETKVIGLVLPDLTNPHFAYLAEAINGACLDAGYMVATYSTRENNERERQILAMMRKQRVDGIILAPTRSDAEHGKFLSQNIHVPVSLIDSHVDSFDHDVFKLDNHRAGYVAGRYLLQLGHRHIAFTGGRANLASGDDRLQGVMDAYAEIRPGNKRIQVIEGAFDRRITYRSTLRMLDDSTRPTAMIAASNMMMVGIFEALNERSLLIPQDMSVIAIAEPETTTLISPVPTLVSAQLDMMASKSVEALLRNVKGNALPRELVMLAPELIVGLSCAPV